MASRGRRNERDNETPRKTTTWVQKKQSPLLKLRANLEKGTREHRRSRSRGATERKNPPDNARKPSPIPTGGAFSVPSNQIDRKSFPAIQSGGLPPKPPKRFEGFTPHSYHMQPHQTRSLADLYDLEFREGDLSRAKEWVQSGGDIDHRFSKGRTLLHYAMLNTGTKDQRTKFPKRHTEAGGYRGDGPSSGDGTLSLVKWLVEMGILVDEPEGVLGETALHIAARLGLVDVVAYLVQRAGADVTKTDVHERTPFHSACALGHPETAMLLLETGCVDLNQKDLHGGSCLETVFAGALIEMLPAAIKARVTASSSTDIANSFVKEASRFVSELSLGNVNVLAVEDFLGQSLVPCYAECFELSMLKSVQSLNKSARVLFVSHRWESSSYPDPRNRQFEIIKRFLQEHEEERFTHIFIDYSCICPEQDKDSVNVHLWNIPTALFCCVSILVIPGLAVGDDGIFQYCSDLNEFSNRAWFQLEAFLGLASGSTMYIAFQAPPRASVQIPWCTPECWAQDSQTPMTTYFHKIVRPTANMLHDANSAALRYFLKSKDNGVNVPQKYLQKMEHEWCGKRPRELTTLLQMGVRVMIGCPELLFDKIRKMSLQPEDMSLVTPDIARRYKKLSNYEDNANEKPYSLNDAYQNLGEISVESDRVMVLRCLMISFAYFMGYLT